MDFSWLIQSCYFSAASPNSSERWHCLSPPIPRNAVISALPFITLTRIFSGHTSCVILQEKYLLPVYGQKQKGAPQRQAFAMTSGKIFKNCVLKQIKLVPSGSWYFLAFCRFHQKMSIFLYCSLILDQGWSVP